MIESLMEKLREHLRHALSHPEDEQGLLGFAAKIAALDASELTQLVGFLLEWAKSSEDEDWPRPITILLGQVTAQPAVFKNVQAAIDPLAELYRLVPADHTLRNHLLAMVAHIGGEDALHCWADLVCQQPPKTALGIELAFAPLLAKDVAISPQWLERLIDEATDNLSVAAPIYDLTNHFFRQGRIPLHPAAKRSAALCEFLGVLVGHLSQIEEGKLPANATPESLSQTVSDSVALIIALIDTLALLKEPSAVGKFNQALELRHRRIQVEAAAGLTRLDDDSGKQHLIECAQHAVVRSRVLAYAKELGFENEISLEFRGAIATAESYLAMWLSEPGQMGLAPTHFELLDQRTLHWPSYEEPQECFLFRFEYGQSDTAYKNVGISGPLTHAFAADLIHLSISDQYAAFAGWQTLSDEIYIVPIDRAEKLLASVVDQLKPEVEREEIASLEFHAVSGFFGHYNLVASGVRNGVEGTLIVEEGSSEPGTWIPHGNSQAPIDWSLALDIWRGRKLLANFNPAFPSDD